MTCANIYARRRFLLFLELGFYLAMTHAAYFSGHATRRLAHSYMDSNVPKEHAEISVALLYPVRENWGEDPA